jgi:hypothetical protein
MTPVAWSLSQEQTISSFRHMEAVVPPKCRYPPVTRLHTQQYNIIVPAVKISISITAALEQFDEESKNGKKGRRIVVG